jgi:hypothetical protein
MHALYCTEEYLDVVPSDVAAGIVLLRATQHEAQQSQESYRQRRHPSIILQQQQLQEQLQLGTHISSVSQAQLHRLGFHKFSLNKMWNLSVRSAHSCTVQLCHAVVNWAPVCCQHSSSISSTVLPCDKYL